MFEECLDPVCRGGHSVDREGFTCVRADRNHTFAKWSAVNSKPKRPIGSHRSGVAYADKDLYAVVGTPCRPGLRLVGGGPRIGNCLGRRRATRNKRGDRRVGGRAPSGSYYLDWYRGSGNSRQYLRNSACQDEDFALACFQYLCPSNLECLREVELGRLSDE